MLSIEMNKNSGTNCTAVLSDRTMEFVTTSVEIYRHAGKGRSSFTARFLNDGFWRTHQLNRVKGTTLYIDKLKGIEDFETYFKQRFPESYDAWTRSSVFKYLYGNK